MDELGRIQTFINVVEAGSFSAAARHVSSVSSVTRQVRSLEEELGVLLLHRNTRSLSLTEAGRRFYERVRGIAHDLRNAKSEAQSYQDHVKGLLRVALRTVTGPTIIVPALPRFLREYPELTLEITLTDLQQDLVVNDIDVAVWMGHPQNADIVARVLTRGSRVVCAAPGYLDRMGVPGHPSDLQSHDCLVHSAHSYTDYWTFTKEGQSQQVVVHGRVRSDNGLVLLSSALSGLGLYVVHDWMVRQPIARGQLVQVMGDYTVDPGPASAQLYAVCPSSRGMSRNVRVFIDFLVDLFKS